ncbi:SWI/SNF-related matrix-associated actin-dependent regulator of chromatin subfamily E member 1-like isoform X2 [Halichondria panicea]|uniref:SWI/SNF-related matrix-associated actin-dependent regulator of chromatin subfamily E member 1-like isoform X2 n=1 Tax=Halichondria panicea TaxID=6063 RepID=UPI00312B36B1
MAGMRPPGGMGMGGFPPSYYGQHPGGHFRPPGYPQMPSSNPSFQSMTNHWNISAPPQHPGYHHHPHTVTSHSYMSGGVSTPPNVGGPPAVMGYMPSGMSKQKHTPQASNASSGQYGQPGVQQPKAPEKPLLPYMRYSRKMWEQLKSEGRRVWEVGKIIGQKWRELSEEEKQPFNDEYEADKARYNEQLKVYRNSVAYRRWQEAKQQAETAAREAANREAAGLSEYGPPPPAVIAPPRQNSAEARLQMMQQEEDDEDEYITKKQLAAIRFHRNHRLMLEIFGDTKIPDTRSVVTNSRLVVLRKQVNSLLLHQRKLESEIKGFDDVYKAKKRACLDNSEKFRRELKRLHETPPTSWKKPALSLASKDLPEPVSDPKYKTL